MYIKVILEILYTNPCFDDPIVRSTFLIKLRIHSMVKLKKIDIVIDHNVHKIDIEFDWIEVNDNCQSICFTVYSKVVFKKLFDVRQKWKIAIRKKIQFQN